MKGEGERQKPLLGGDKRERSDGRGQGGIIFFF